MARPGVTYEQVASVANQMYSQGVREPGNKAVREALAKIAGPSAPIGSPNTIQRHLTSWRNRDRPVDLANHPSLPHQLAGDLARALTAAADVAREKAEERLAQVLIEQDELVTIGEAAEARIEALDRELADRTTERDRLAGRLNERTVAAEGHQAALSSALSRLKDQEAGASRALAEAQAAVGRTEEIRASSMREREELQQALGAAQQAYAAEQRRAGEAEVRAAGAEARVTGLLEAKKMLEGQVEQLTATTLRLEGEALRTASAEAEAAGLREQVRLLTDSSNLLKQMMRASGALGT